jgi:hypothetical protein
MSDLNNLTKMFMSLTPAHKRMVAVGSWQNGRAS